MEKKVEKPTHLTVSYLDEVYAQDHSPALSQKIKVPQKQYSSQEDPLRRMATPVFDKHEQENRKKGPSSAATVLALSGLFVVGTTLILSGIIVLIVQQEPPFVVTGCLFLGIGVAMLLVCVALQRKNLVKFVLDINRDLYFLNMSKSYMFKSMFEINTELPLSHGGNAKLVVESVMPDFFHVVPVGNDTMLNWVLKGKDTSLGLGLVSDVRVFLSHTDHDSLMTRSSDNGWEHGAWSVVSSESSFAHSGSIVNYESGNIVVTHDLLD